MTEWISDIYLDLRYAVRNIAAATTVFSIVDAVLLRPLPYKNPDRLAAVWITSTREKGLAKLFATHAGYLEFQRHSRTLESVSAATWAAHTGRVLTGIGPAREVLTIPATASFFDTLGVRAAIGRTFSREDEGQGCSILLAHQFWTTNLGGDATVVGKSLTMDRKPCAVLGVMPEGSASIRCRPRLGSYWDPISYQTRTTCWSASSPV